MKKTINICNVYLFNRSEKKVLLIFKTNGSQKYYAPGGKIETTETSLEAAQREFFEETNLKLKDIKFATNNTHIFDDQIINIDSYYSDSHVGTPNHITREGEINWFNWNDIDELDMLMGDKTVLKDLINNDIKREYTFRYDRRK